MVEKFAVRFQSHTKAVKVEDESELLEEIKKAYDLVPEFPKQFTVQFEDKDLNCYVDLEQPEDLQDRSSNILLVKESHSRDSLASSADNLESIRNNEIGANYQEPSLDSNEQSFSQDEPSSSNNCTGSGLPRPFLIKDYMLRKNLIVELNRGKIFLSESERSTIFKGIFDECQKYDNIYPSKEEYNGIIESIFKRFPSLAKESISYNATFDLWHERLRNHFKAERFRMRSDLPELLQNQQKYGKRKLPRSENADETPKKKTMCWGVSNFLPDIEEGEDEETFGHYQKEMADQL